MKRFRCGIFKAILFFLATTVVCRAHAPYEIPRGVFKRPDGLEVQVSTRFVDGILGPDPGAVIFRLPDRSIITNTALTHDDLIVRHAGDRVEIWDFMSNWLPITSKVQSFDGAKLTKSSGPSTIWISPAIHVYGHPIDYVIALTLSLSFCAGVRFLRSLPKTDSNFTIKFLIAILGCMAAAAFVVTSASPIVVGIPIAIAMFVWKQRTINGRISPTETGLESSSPQQHV